MNAILRSKPIRILTIPFILILFSVFFPACNSGDSRDSGERALIRVGESYVTVRDFNEEFESSITSPSVLYSDPEALRDEKYRALVRMTEELIIIERARELGLSVSDDELAKAVSDFKQDFPDDTFEKTLIENGISYLLWEKGLRRRLLMEKVVRKDISESSFQVPLPYKKKAESETETADASQTPGDGVAPVTGATGDAEAERSTDEEQNEPVEGKTALTPEPSENEETAPAESPHGSGTENLEIPDYAIALPENIMESQYNAWMDRLKAQYKVEIDWELWKKIEQEGDETTQSVAGH